MTIYAHAFWAWYPFRRRSWVGWFVVGAVVPDLPYLLVFAAAVLRAGPGMLADLGLWHSLWRNPLICALHSFVPWGVVLLGAVVLLRARNPAPAPIMGSSLAFILGWGFHVILDMFTHRSDGYPIFWPLSDYRFPTPISYWEPSYHGVAFSLACDGLIALLLLRLVVQRWRGPTASPSHSGSVGRSPSEEHRNAARSP